MSDPFVAEIRMFTGSFAPRGWATCNGQLMPISQNTALFSLLGTTYGGDGRSTFALPNLMGASPMQSGQGPSLSQRDLGESGGAPSVSLLPSQIPSHTHTVAAASAAGTQNTPTGAVLGQASFGRRVDRLYATSAGSTTLNPGAVAVAGGSVPHDNLPPYLTLTFIIALQGVFPPRS
ncbi:phage tail protein [Curtobacterium sp. RRHDQ10]|uniref:phage tail protein n=1 Tax=Curtobacterium phyllosphaerae TaxID=3413379 RepID=UPI003BEFA1E4